MSEGDQKPEARAVPRGSGGPNSPLAKFLKFKIGHLGPYLIFPRICLRHLAYYFFLQHILEHFPSLNLLSIIYTFLTTYELEVNSFGTDCAPNLLQLFLITTLISSFTKTQITLGDVPCKSDLKLELHLNVFSNALTP